MNASETLTRATTRPSIAPTLRRIANLPMLIGMAATLIAVPGSASAQTGFDPSSTRIEVEIIGLTPGEPTTFTALTFAAGQTNASDVTASGYSFARPVSDDFMITKSIDAASAKLAGSAVTGRVLQTVIIRAYRYDPASESEVLYMEMTASGVFVSIHRICTSSVRDPWTANEQVAFKFSSILWSYPEAGVSYGWNRRTNQCTGC